MKKKNLMNLCSSARIVICAIIFSFNYAHASYVSNKLNNWQNNLVNIYSQLDNEQMHSKLDSCSRHLLYEGCLGIWQFRWQSKPESICNEILSSGHIVNSANLELIDYVGLLYTENVAQVCQFNYSEINGMQMAIRWKLIQYFCPNLLNTYYRKHQLTYNPLHIDNILKLLEIKDTISDKQNTDTVNSDVSNEDNSVISQVYALVEEQTESFVTANCNLAQIQAQHPSHKKDLQNALPDQEINYPVDHEADQITMPEHEIKSDNMQIEDDPEDIVDPFARPKQPMSNNYKEAHITIQAIYKDDEGMLCYVNDQALRVGSYIGQEKIKHIDNSGIITTNKFGLDRRIQF